MPKFIYTGFIALLIMGVTGFAPGAHAETTATATHTAMLEQIQALMAKLQELQKQLATIRGEISSVLKENITEGTDDSDVKRIQEILATDSTIYPEGKVTGYFGPLTKEAIKRFQVRHELKVTGTIDGATHDLLEEYLKETKNGTIPPGLLKAPGIEKRMEMRFREGCDNGEKGKADFCRKLKVKYENDELKIEKEINRNGVVCKAIGTRSEGWYNQAGDLVKSENCSTNKDETDMEDGNEVEIDIDGTTWVSMVFTFNGKEYSVDGELTDIDKLLKATADKINVRVEKLDTKLRNEIKRELIKALDEENKTEDANGEMGDDDSKDDNNSDED